jgi:hypothetical protein
MYQFKAEYQNARVTVKTNSFGKVEINTSNADANKWAIVPELAFMIESVNAIEPKQETKAVNYEDMSLKELREMFPDITANSKKAFIDQL